jgi:chromosome segregation ATPase
VASKEETEGLNCVLQEDTEEIEVSGLHEEYVASAEEMLQLLSTALEARSDDSTLFIEITVQQKHLKDKTLRIGRVSFIDLEASQSQIDDSQEADSESDNGQDTFMDIGKAVMKNDTNHNYYESSLKALLYSRSFRNSDTRLVVCCSPAISQVKRITEPNLEFAQNMKAINLTCNPNIHTASDKEPVHTNSVEDISPSKSGKPPIEKGQQTGNGEKTVSMPKEAPQMPDTAELDTLRNRCLQLENTIKSGQEQLEKAKRDNAQMIEKLTGLQKNVRNLQSAYKNTNITAQLKQFSSQQNEKLLQISNQIALRIARYEESMQEKMSRNIADLKSRADDLQHENNQLLKKMETVIEQRKALEKQIAEKSAQISELKEQLIEKTTELEIIRDENAKYGQETDQIAGLNSKVNDLELAILRLTDELNEREVELRKSNEEVEKLKEVRSETEKLKEKVAKLTYDSTQQIEKLNQKLKDSENANHKILADLNSSKLKLQQVGMQFEELNSKFKDSQQNLNISVTKMNGLLAELQDKQHELDQMELQAQMEKERSDQLNREIEKLNSSISNLNNDINSKKTDINNLQDQITSLQTELKELKLERDTLSKKYRESEEKLKDQEENLRQIKQLKSDIQNLKAQIESKEDSITSLKAQMSGNQNDLQKQLQQQLSQIEKLESDKLTLKYDLSEKMEEISTLKSQLKKVERAREEEINRLKSELDFSIHDNSQLKKEIRELNDTINAAETAKSQLNSHVKLLNDKIEEKNSQIHEKEAHVKKLAEEKLTIEREAQSLREQLSSKSQSLSNSTNQADILKKQILEKTEQITKMEVELVHAKNVIVELTSEKDNMESKISQLESTIQTLQSNLEVYKKEEKNLRSKVQELNTTIAVQDQRIKASQEEKADLEQLINNLKTEQRNFTSKIEQLQKSTNLSSSQELQEKINTVNLQQKEIKALKDTLAAHTKKVSEMRKQLSKSEIQSMKQKDTIETMLKEKESWQAELNNQLQEVKEEAERELNAAKQRWEFETTELKNISQALRDEVQVKASQIENLNDLIIHYKNRISELENKLDGLDKEHKEEISALQEKTQELRDQIDNMQREKSEAITRNEAKLDDQKIKELEDLKQRVAQLESQNMSLRDEARTYEKQLKELMSKRASISIDRKQNVVIPKGSTIIKSGGMKNVDTLISGDQPSIMHSDKRSMSKSGFLKKEGEKVKSWKKRWFIIHIIEDNPNAFKLAYYKNMGDKKPIKELILTRDTTVNEAPEKETASRKYCFKVVCKNRILYLHCVSEEERREWMSALKLVISTCN